MGTGNIVKLKMRQEDRHVQCDSLDDALSWVEKVLKSDKRSYYEIMVDMGQQDLKVSYQTLMKLGGGEGPALRFETLRRIAAYYNYVLIIG